MEQVYLDDWRPCPQGFTVARDAEMCKSMIDELDIDILSLDYDLGWGNPTGYDVAAHIVATGRYPKRIYMHSSSDMGRLRMYELLAAHVPAHVQLSGAPMPEEVKASVATASRANFTRTGQTGDDR